MALDALVESATPYRRRPVWTHGYAAPFAFLYAAVAYLWLVVWGYEEHYELGCILVGAVFVLQALTGLFCHWFVDIKAIFTCSFEPNVWTATLVKVKPTPNNGWAEIVPLRQSRLNGKAKLWFEFQKVHYVYDEDRKTFKTMELDTNKPFKDFQKALGVESDEQLAEIRHEFGDNKMEMVIPEFLDLFIERATAPFFVFQVFCVGLWCLEDMWYYSLFTLLMLATFEATLVKQQLKNMSEIRNMGNKPYMIYAYRNRRWNRIKSDELVPGDIVSIGFINS